MENIGEKIIRLRFENHLTIKEAAQKLGVSPKTYSNYEKGRIKILLDKFIAICILYDVSADYLLGLKR